MEIEWHIERRKVSLLKPYSKNPRKITKDQYEHLKRNIKKFGLIDKPFINLDNTLIGGHQRTRLWKEFGYDEVDVFVPSRMLTEKEVEELNYRHNENGGFFDDDILANQYDHLDLMMWGEDPIKKEEKEKKKIKPKVVFEFEEKEDLEEALESLEQVSLHCNASMKVKM